MRKHYVKHENLRKCLEEIHTNYDNLTEDVIKRFINELKHSCLILAADISQDEISFQITDVDGKEYGLLFTDMDEFKKTVKDNYHSHEFDFHVYQMIIENNVLDGFIINPETEGFLFKKELFLKITDLPKHNYSTDDTYTTGELKKVKDTVDNRELEEFIKNPANIGKYEELFEKISKSTLFTLMLSPKDLTDYNEDGVINMSETGPLGFLYTDDVGGEYATVYTSESKISHVETDLYKYSQLINFSIMVNFILNDDMDGLIINPNSENILITREVLLEYAFLLQETCNDSRLNNAIMHMFLIDNEV